MTASGSPTITRAPYGTTPEGRAVELFTLRNARGVELCAISYGGIITALRVPDRAGRFDDVVLGFDSLGEYLPNPPYFGAIIGRYCNRIADASLPVGGELYALVPNEGKNQLHGGPCGFDKAVWSAEPHASDEGMRVVFSHTSPDGDQGYPGRVEARVSYTLTDRDELVVDYHATTDRPTVVNLTQHSYFNLAGEARNDVLAHELTLRASHFTPVDRALIPTGEIRAVAGTPFDFRAPHAIGARIAEPDEQLALGGGYDQNFVIDRTGPGLVHAAHVHEPVTGRTLDVHTTQPGVQLYTANSLGASGALRGKGGRVYSPNAAFCLETQHYPDSPHHPNFPSTVLRPGAVYHERTVYAFGVR